LYFGGLKNNELNQSHIGHFTVKGALKCEDTNSFNGKVSNWDWTEIQLTSKKLKQQIHNNMATQKLETIDILSGASTLEKAGTKLR